MIERLAERSVGRSVWDPEVPTPLVYVDISVCKGNIEKMATLARDRGVALRPHAKTHKLAAIARLQVDAGAVGLTVAKLSEAALLDRAGVATEYLIAQPFSTDSQTEELVAFSEGHAVLCCFDDASLAERVGESFARKEKEAAMLLIVDTGYGRMGVPDHRALEVAASMSRRKGVKFVGIRSHAGHIYRKDSPEERLKVAREEAERMAETANRIRAMGLDCPIVSIGSTPGSYLVLRHGLTEGITELRPGNYVFHDRMQVSMGLVSKEDCALRIVTSIVSVPERGRAIIDAGLKTLSGTLDRLAPGYGLVVNLKDAVIDRLWEECGSVRSPEPLNVGQRLLVIPNHACEITNLAPVVFYGSGGFVEGYWVPEARGCVW